MGIFPNTENPGEKQPKLRVLKVASIAAFLLFAGIFLLSRNADPATDASLFARAGSGATRSLATISLAFDRTFLRTPRFLAEVPLDDAPPGADAPQSAKEAPARIPAAPAAKPKPSHPVFISEVCVGTERGGSDEFIELYNPNDVPFDLSGWYVKKRSSTGNESALVSAARLDGKSVPPGSHFLIVNEGGYGGLKTPDAAWPKSYTLAYSKNAVILYNESGGRADEAAWENIPKGASLGRSSQDPERSLQAPNPENTGDM